MNRRDVAELVVLDERGEVAAYRGSPALLIALKARAERQRSEARDQSGRVQSSELPGNRNLSREAVMA